MDQCKAYQQSDEMFCPTCGYRWDVNDPAPPKCRTQTLVRIVGLTGLAGSGKSTAAEYLERQHGYVRLRFAAPLKNALRRMLQDALVDDHTIERMIEGDLKEVPQPVLLGKTPRHAMQRLGTEWGRHCIGEAFWVNLLQNTIEGLPPGTRIVVEDVRFTNEAKMLRSLGGKIIRMEGRGGIAGSHPSEAGVGFTPDMTCYNGGAMSDMRRWFDYVLTITKS
jgi:hypothetical protein